MKYQKRSKDFPNLTNKATFLKALRLKILKQAPTTPNCQKKHELASDINGYKSKFHAPKQWAKDRLRDQALTNVKTYANAELQSEP